MSGNYDRQLAAARQTFLRSGLATQARSVRFLGRRVEVDRESGAVCTEDGKAAEFSLAMTVYDYLAHLPNAPVASGRYVAHEQLNAVRGGTLGARLAVSREKAGAPFAGRVSALRAACLRLGGRERQGGDFSAVLPLLDELCVCLRFYDADEEFPAQLQLLWDAHTPQFLTYETTWYTTSAILDALAEETR